MTSSADALLPEGTFFFPGPTEVRPAVLASMTRPMIPHRGAAFEQLFAGLQDSLRTIFGTTRSVFVSSSSATGLMEAGIRCAPPGRVLCLVNGAFSARFAAIARACGRDVDVLESEWGAVVEPDRVRDALRAGRHSAVTVVHSETSTGVRSDVRLINRIAREEGATCLVDSVTGVGGAELGFDEWELDYALTGSQKALALPPGLAFAVASERFMTSARSAPARGLYFDLVEFDAYAAKHQTPNTPAISLFYAAEVQFGAIVAEGMASRWARHDAMARRTWAWASELRARHGDAYGVLAPESIRSPTVTSVTLPSSLTASTIRSAVKALGFTIGGGYGQNRETTVRIGHMGDHVVPALDRCLSACSEAIERLSR